MPSPATAAQSMAALLGCWKDATSTPCTACGRAALATTDAARCTVLEAPTGPASWCSNCGEWVLPTLERFGPEEAEAWAVANGPTRTAMPRLTVRAQAPEDHLDTRAHIGSLPSRLSRSTAAR